MKMPVFKFLFSLLFIFGAVIFFASQVLAVAPVEKGNKKDVKDIKKEEIVEKSLTRACKRIENNFSKLAEQGKVLKAKMKIRREKKENVYMERLKEREKNISEMRVAIDKNFEANIDKMLDKATTAEEKVAIESFKATVKKARETRRVAVDLAHQTFQNEIKNQIRNREQNLEGLTNTFKNTVDDAFKVAKNSCDEGGDIKKIRYSFRASVKKAYEKFQNEKKNREKIGEAVSQATKVKNAAIKKANETFKNSLQEAINKLKDVFKEVK
jgi:hypothetical protein